MLGHDCARSPAIPAAGQCAAPRPHRPSAPACPRAAPRGRRQELELGTKPGKPFSRSWAPDDGEGKGAGPCLRNHGLVSEMRPSPKPSCAELGALGPRESPGKRVSVAAVAKVLGSAGF